jgi:methionyl-tRNA formyltransferase
MRVFFLGSSEFGLPTLRRLWSELEVVGVGSQPPRPRGRNRKVTPTPIASWAADADIPLIESGDINADAALVDALHPDVLVVIAFGQKLSEEFIGDRLAINLHASLLPRWRGAAPINWAIMAGDAETGNSVITLADRMDAGEVLAQESTPIGPLETAGELHDRLAASGPDLIMAVLGDHERGCLMPRPQDASAVTKAAKLSRANAKLDFSRAAAEVAARIRGLSPWPGCHVKLDGVDCKLLRAEASAEGSARLGEVGRDGLIGVRQGSVRILELQPAGGRSMDWQSFIVGHPVEDGSQCEAVG